MQLRNSIVEHHLGLASRLARQFRRPGMPEDDLLQVAHLALVEAVDRFDPDRDVPLWSFAGPTIAGTIKKYFRENWWMLRMPRRVKELHLEIQAVSEELTQHHARTPTTADLAAHLRRAEDEVADAQLAARSACPMSIDAPISHRFGIAPFDAVVGQPDHALDVVDSIVALRPLIAALPERERRVLGMRFYDDLTQAQIGERIGCSQMHVSRLLRAALTRLRHGLHGDDVPIGTFSGHGNGPVARPR